MIGIDVSLSTARCKEPFARSQPDRMTDSVLHPALSSVLPSVLPSLKNGGAARGQSARIGALLGPASSARQVRSSEQFAPFGPVSLAYEPELKVVFRAGRPAACGV